MQGSSLARAVVGFASRFQGSRHHFRVAYWKPETTINETAKAQYERNILHCTRQLHYSVANENSIDIMLFLNGIPVVSMELKNQFTGQDTDNAIRHYKFDRANKDTIFEFKNRVLVHFAVDLYNVFMTTHLQGANTYFLPFNQRSNGAEGLRYFPTDPDARGFQQIASGNYDLINFHNKWTNCKTKLGAPLLFSELS